MPRYVIDCASDTHGTHKALKFKPPAADYADAAWIFVHAGDSTKYGTTPEVSDFASWLKTLPHKYRLVIAGNHERETDPVWVANERTRIANALTFKLEKDADPEEVKAWRDQVKRERKRLRKLHVVDIRAILGAPGVATYLDQESAEIRGIKFYGSPYTPKFYAWGYQYERGPEAHAHWASVPEDTHVLISHGPPRGILDAAHDHVNGAGMIPVGCAALLKRVLDVKPQLHVFGHIHDHFGAARNEHTTFVNASSVLPYQYQARFKFIRVYGSTETGSDRCECLVTTV